jgi:hypothetical protein
MAQTSKNAPERATAADDDIARTGRRMVETAEDLTGRSAETIQDLLALPSRAAMKLFTAEGELACAWVELAGQQAAHQAETLQRLAAARDWREAVEIQKGFVHDSLGRVAEAVDRCLDLQGELVVANLLGAGEAPARQVA